MNSKKSVDFDITCNLENIMKSKGVTSVSRMAALLRLTRPTIYNHLSANSDELELIRLKTIIQILYALDVKFEDLFSWDIKK
jgi:DNA-binding phage protein